MQSPARSVPILLAALLVYSPWARPLAAQELPEPGTPIRMQVRGVPDAVAGRFESLGPAGLVYTTPDGRSAPWPPTAWSR